MKNVFKGLKLTEKDNKLTAAAKGGTIGGLAFLAVAVPVLSTLAIMGKVINRNDEMEVFEMEMEAE